MYPNEPPQAHEKCQTCRASSIGLFVALLELPLRVPLTMFAKRCLPDDRGLPADAERSSTPLSSGEHRLRKGGDTGFVGSVTWCSCDPVGYMLNIPCTRSSRGHVLQSPLVRDCAPSCPPPRSFFLFDIVLLAQTYWYDVRSTTTSPSMCLVAIVVSITRLQCSRASR